MQIPRAEAARIEAMSRAELARYARLVPEPKMDGGMKSGYCRPNKQATQRGLGKHDFKVTILKGKRDDQ